VSIDSAKGELLTLFLACLAEETVGEASVVAMIMLDADAVLCGEALERELGVDGFFARQIARHQIHELEARVMVDENGGVAITRLGECSF